MRDVKTKPHETYLIYGECGFVVDNKADDVLSRCELDNNGAGGE